MSLKLKHIKEKAASAITTAEDNNDTIAIHVIVDYRVGICLLNMLISAMFLTRCCPIVLRR